MQKGGVLLLILPLLFISCKKEHADNNCKRLKDGIVANQADNVKAAVNTAISQLQSKDHTAENLSALATLLTTKCGATAEVLCFSCIYTNPSQSEISVTFHSGGTTYTKVIDITNSVSNKMVFWNMHEL
jgi:hypothetical protein